MQLFLKDSGHVEAVSAILRDGGIVLYPTDTLYGLGADALSDEAVDRVYAIKGRDDGKPMHAIVADLAMAERYAYVDDVARKLAKRFLPGALTLILKKRSSVTTGIGRDITTIGVRIPAETFCTELARAFDGPITTTSANLSGELPQRAVHEILAQLGVHTLIIDGVVDAGELQASKPSTVVDLSGPRPLILREGAIASSEILEELEQGTL